MKISQRLKVPGRVVARAARRSERGPAQRPAQGPAAVYARVLDGEHLWVAVSADAGRPALWDETAGGLVDAVDDLPTDHVELDPSCRSARIRLPDAVPLREDAELVVVVVAGDGEPVAVRPPAPAPANRLRVPPTPDGRWRFALVQGDDGSLRVRRTAAAAVSRLLDVSTIAGTVVLTCAAPPGDPSDSGGPGDPAGLHFLDKAGTVAHSVPAAREGNRLVAVLAAADLPSRPAGYRVAVGTADAHAAVVRRHNDLVVDEPSAVLMPTVIDPATEDVAGRFQLNPHGVLRLVRTDAGAEQPA